MSKVTSYGISTIKPNKTPAIWVIIEPNIAMPVCYLRKPKWLTDDQWEAVLGAIRFEATAGILEGEG